LTAVLPAPYPAAVQPPPPQPASEAAEHFLSRGIAAAGYRVWTHHCDLCGARMFEKHCKIRCPNCGYIRDCSDP
jgi:uncharacterized Zn finger protein (UPF0148 family)